MADARIVIAATDATSGAFASVKGKLAGLQGEAGRVGAAFAALAPQVAALATGAGLTAFLQSAVDGLDALNDVADATGASIENISALEDIARRTGTSFDTMSGALVKFNQALGAARAGSEAERVFQALGLSVEELRRLDPAQAFSDVAQALARFADDGEKARAAQVLFGRSLREVAPLLKDVAEAGTLAATATAEQAAEAEKFNQSLFALQANAARFARTLAADLLPTVNNIVGALNEGSGAVSGFATASSAIRTVLETLTILGANVAFVFRGVGNEIGGIAAQLAALGRGDIAGFRAISQAMKEDAERARKELEQFEQRVLGRVLRGRPPNEGGGALASNIRETLRIPDAPTRAPRSGGGSGERLGNFNPYGLPVGPQFDSFIGPEIDDALRRAREQAARELESLIGRSDASRLDAVADKARLLADAWNEGSISLEDYSRGVEVLSRDFEALRPKIDETAKAVDEFTLQAARNIQDTLGDTLLATLEGDFDSIADLWKRTLMRMAAEAAAAQLGRLLLGDFAKTGQVGGWIGDAIRVISGTFGGARAMGGPVMPGKTYLVGEQGPELLRMGGSGGTVVPNSAIGGQTIQQTFVINGDVSPATVALVRREALRVRSEILRSMSTGGAYAA